MQSRFFSFATAIKRCRLNHVAKIISEVLVTIVAISTRNVARFNIDIRGNEKIHNLEDRRFAREDSKSTPGKRLIASDVAGIFGNDNDGCRVDFWTIMRHRPCCSFKNSASRRDGT